MPQIVLPVTLEDVAAREDHLSLAVLETFRDSAVIDLTHDLTEFVFGVIKELMPVNRDVLTKQLWDHKFCGRRGDFDSVQLLILFVVLDLFECLQATV